MAWVRIEDHFPDHPKVVAVGPLAAWLYVAGLCYCNRLLTNGFIPLAQIAKLVPESCQPHAKTLCEAGLWTEVNRKNVPGFFVHDYLKYQPSKKVVEAKRKLNARRQGRYRHGSNAPRNGVTNAPRNGVTNASSNGVSNAPSNAPVTRVPIPIPIPTQEEKKEREKSASLSPAAQFSDPKRDPFTDAAVTQRAGAFVERYQALYSQHRKGARYAVRPVRDYAAAVTLCQTWPDDARLDKLAVIFLTTDHKFAEEGSRTIPQFLALASWADGRLAEHEKAKKSGAA